METTLTVSLIVLAQAISVFTAYAQVVIGLKNSQFYWHLSNKKKGMIIAISTILAVIVNIVAGLAAYGTFGTGTWQIVGIIVLSWNVFWAFGWFVFVMKYGHDLGLIW